MWRASLGGPWGWMGLVAVLVLAGGRQAAAQQPVLPDDPLGYAILALDDLVLGARTRTSGAVGVNGSGGTATVGRSGRVTGVVAADTITLKRGATADQMACRFVSGGEGDCATLSLPMVTAASLPIVQVDAGSPDIVVPRRSRGAPLQPDTYGRLEIGQASTIELAGGDYSFEAVRVGARSTLLCVTPCRIGIRGSLALGQATRLGPRAGSQPADVRVSIESAGGDVALDAKSRAVVTALVYAPAGAIRIGQASRVEGALVGTRVTVGARSRITAAP